MEPENIDDKEFDFEDDDFDDFAMKVQKVKLGINNTGDLVNNYLNSFTQ